MKGVISSPFGYRINPVTKKTELHNGLDIAVKIGTSVVAVSDGVISDEGKSATFGNFIKYKFDDYTVLYGHLSKIIAKKGDRVKQGQVIALSGNTGRSTGPHLHYSIWKGNELEDPAGFVTLAKAE